MLVSTESQEPFTRVSECQTGQLLNKETDGKLMLTPDKLGTTLWLISILSAPQCNSLVKDKNQILSNGSDSNNLVKVLHQDFSTTKSQTHGGIDTEDILTIQKRSFTPSPTLINKLLLTLESTQPQMREELPGLLSTLVGLSLPQK
jgi:hypothetical protein